MTPHEFRQRFPGLTNMVYLASCSQGAMSDLLESELAEYQRSIVENGADWANWILKVDEARALFAKYVGADLDEVAIVSSASEGAYQAASTQAWAARPGIVTTDLEFPSVAHVWLAQEPVGARVSFVDDHDLLVDVEDYVSKIDHTTGLVSIPLVSYRNGLRLPVSEVTAIAHERGARVFVDAYQGLGVLPVNVRALDCDYLVSGTLKYLLGIPGIAFLYVRGGLVDDRPPGLTGWFGRVDPYEFDPRRIDHPAHARRFEVGTPSVAAAYGAVAGLNMLAQLDMHAVEAYVGALTGLLREELMAAGEVIATPDSPSRRGPMVALQDRQPEDLEAALRRVGIATSPRGDLLRLALHYYNDESDVVATVKAIGDYRARQPS